MTTRKEAERWADAALAKLYAETKTRPPKKETRMERAVRVAMENATR